MPRIYNLLDQAQDRRAKWFIEIGYLLVRAIDSQGVLDEIIRSDIEEIYFGSQNIRGHRSDGVSTMTPTWADGS